MSSYVRYVPISLGGGGGGGGAITIGTIDSQTIAANGAVASGMTLYMQSADATHPGLINATTQSFGGNKTFTGAISASNLSGTNTGNVTIAAFGSSPNANGLSLSSQVLNLQPADATHSGGLSSTDWNTFNNKQAALTLGNLTDAGTDGIVVTGGSGAVVGSGTSIAQHVADSTHNGYLSSADWSTFNAKQAALTLTNLTDAGTDGIVITNGTGAVVGASPVTLAQHVADSTHNGYLSSTDWSTFNGKQASGNYITALTGDVTASGPGSVAASLVAITNSTLTTLSALVSVGTITTGTWSATTIALNKGGTGQTTKAAAFDALSPMSAGGDIVYGGASGTGTRLANGSSGQVLTSAGGTSAPTWATPSTILTGMMFAYGGFTEPSGYLFCSGIAQSRATYAALFAAITISQTGSFTNANPVVTALSDTSNMVAGMPIGGSKVNSTTTTILSVDSPTQITMSANATSGGSATLDVCPYGVGDASTTFNVPDKRGRTSVGRDNMGGSTASRMTTGGAAINGLVIGAAGGSQTVALTSAQNGQHTHTGVVRLSATVNHASVTALGASTVDGVGNNTSGQDITDTSPSSATTAHQNTQPSLISNWIIKT